MLQLGRSRRERTSGPCLAHRSAGRASDTVTAMLRRSDELGSENRVSSGARVAPQTVERDAIASHGNGDGVIAPPVSLLGAVDPTPALLDSGGPRACRDSLEGEQASSGRGLVRYRRRIVAG